MKKGITLNLYLIALLLMLFSFISCMLPREATKEDNKRIKSIIKDGDFLYRNFLDDKDVHVSETQRSLLYEISVRADEEYEFNTVIVEISKEKKGAYCEGTYKIELSQKSGVLEVAGKFLTKDASDEFVDKSIVRKLIASTEKFDRIKLDGESLKIDSAAVDVF